MAEAPVLGSMTTQRTLRLSRRRGALFIGVCFTLLSFFHGCVDARSSRPVQQVSRWTAVRGGAVKTFDEREAYTLLASAVRDQLESDDGKLPEISKIVKSFKSLSSAQQAFKGLDGAAHEAYQRTHSTDDVDISVSGRALRSAARVGAAADGLGACELCELVDHPELVDLNSPNGTMAGREVLLNVTDAVSINGVNSSVLVLFEPAYRGGCGVHHGGIEEEGSGRMGSTKGRLVIVIGDNMASDLGVTLKVLGQAPLHVRLNQGTASEAASVQASLYKAAGSLLQTLEPILLAHNSAAIHFVGRSLGGGVASLAASILDGRLPMPSDKKKRSRKKKKPVVELERNATTIGDSDNSTMIVGVQGLGRDRSSALSLGAPPCISANVQTDFVTSILYGDDIICRSSKESIDRFLSRTRKSLKKGGIVGRQMNRMTDTISLAASSLKSHAHGSEGEEARLSIPGRAYLVRPRRLGKQCSIHEVGAQLKGGREALRAAVFWQLSDVLLSKSLWKHHELGSYIHGLDRVHLRGVDDDASGAD